MAIHLITGVPGAGKSLRAVWCAVNRLSSEQEQDRPIFGNVRGFRRQSPLPGSRYQNQDGEFEDIAGEWMDCPDGSIIMIDEVQERWRRYRSTGEPPAEIAALERHRHRNIDFILTCQNPKQLSDDVRALVDSHEHLTKKGKGSATVYRWSGRCSTSPYTNRKDPDCEVDFWRYPKWVFREYVSASEHTVRNKTPRIFKIAAFMCLLIPASLYFVYSRFSGMVPETEAQEVQAPLPETPQSEVVPASYSPAPSSPAPVKVSRPPAELVTVIGGIRGTGDNPKCKLFDENRHYVNTTWPDCMNILERGIFPAQVEKIRFDL